MAKQSKSAAPQASGYYDAFIAAWNNPTQPPPPAQGTGITPSMTTQQKLDCVNGWTVTGAIPTSILQNANDIANCVNYAEFKALTATQQSNLMNLLAIQGGLLGGSDNNALLTNGMLSDYFTNKQGPTFTALKALAKGVVQPWWKYAGYPRPFDMGDCQAAGVS